MDKLIFPMKPKEAKEKGVSNLSVLNKKTVFPEKLRQLRAEKSISQKEFATQIGVTKSTISLYEHGDNVPDIKTFAKIADFYNVSYDYLLGKSENRDRENIEMGKELGLSDYAISVLKRLNGSDNKRFSSTLTYLNMLFECDLDILLIDIAKLDEAYKMATKIKDEYYKPLNEEQVKELETIDMIVSSNVHQNSERPGFISVDLTTEMYADFEIQRLTKHFYNIIEQIIERS